MYICDFEKCSSEFKKKWQLQEHLVKHTGQRPFKCKAKGCDKAFTRQSHLQRHQQTHSVSDRKDFLCSEDGCGQVFTSKYNLKKHMKRKHSEKASEIKCSYEGCGKVFLKKQTLKIHQYEHTNVKPFRCEHVGCDASFLLPSKLKRHAKMHEGYKCTEEGCNEEFTKWSLLRKHVAEDHISEYECSKCKKVFYKKYKLRVHMKYHRDSKEVFMCPREGCQYTALRVNELDLHIQNYHEGARPFVCQFEGCTKTFGHKNSKLKHQIVHSPGYVKPQPKPQRKRGLPSKLAGYPDEGTRGPRHMWKSKNKEAISNRTKTLSSAVSAEVAMESREVCEQRAVGLVTPQECASIHEGTDSNQTENEDDVEINVVVVTLDTALREIQTEVCPISEIKPCDTGVGAEVEIPEENVDDNRTENTDQNMDDNSKAGSDSLASDDVVMTTGHTYMVTKVALASDLESETGAEDLDSLIQAVTKSRNSTTKETVITSQGLTDKVMVT